MKLVFLFLPLAWGSDDATLLQHRLLVVDQQQPCEDNYPADCPGWSRFCKGPPYEDWMADNCCETCSLESLKPTTTTTTTPAPPPLPATVLGGYTTPPGCLSEPATPDATSCSEGDTKTKGPREYMGCQLCTCTDAQWVCEGQLRTRKEISDVSDADFAVFADAVNKLQLSGDWQRLVNKHVDGYLDRTAHGEDRFLHWHRKYLYDVDTLLQAAANRCDVTIPYWNWALDYSLGGNNEQVFGQKRFGNAAGNAQREGTFNHDSSENKTNPDSIFGAPVTDGLFGIGSPFGSNNATPILRGWDGTSPIAAGSMATLEGNLEERFSSDDDIRCVFEREAPPDCNTENRSSFAVFIESHWHNNWHGGLGGHQFSGRGQSPYDPLFFSHHAFVDKIWFDWQNNHLATTGAERNWASSAGEKLSEGLKHLVCDNGDSTNLPSKDVEVSMHMTGRENGRVQYLDRQEDSDCGEHWATIQCCMTAISAAEKWHEVARLRADISDVSDICNPLGASDWVRDHVWVNHIQALRGMTQEQALSVVDDLQELDESLPNVTAADASTCEKKLCMAVTTATSSDHSLMGVCQSVANECF